MILDGLLQLVGASAEDDADDRSPTSDFWFNPIGYSSAFGGYLAPDLAMRCAAVFACVKIIAETLGSLPCITYRRLDRGKERATDHAMYRLLRYQPNRWQTPIQFFEMLTAHAALRGTGYAEKRYNGAGVLEELVPLHPDYMRVDELEDGRLGFLYTERRSGTVYRYNEDEIFLLPGFSTQGRLGLSVVQYMAQSIGMALSAEEYGARFFQNDATPGGILSHPTHFKDKEARENFRKAWQRAQTGSNRQKTAVLEDGMKFEALGITNVEAQFLESRKFQISDIARVFRMPLVLLGETEKSTSWGTGIEQFMLAFVTHTIRPWCTRWEQGLALDFFVDDAGEPEFFCEFLLDALLRGDIKTRYEAYSKGIQDGHLLRNEAREMENRNPLPGLDEPLTPSNTQRSDQTKPAGDQPTAADSSNEDDSNA